MFLNYWRFGFLGLTPGVPPSVPGVSGGSDGGGLVAVFGAARTATSYRCSLNMMGVISSGILSREFIGE